MPPKVNQPERLHELFASNGDRLTPEEIWFGVPDRYGRTRGLFPSVKAGHVPGTVTQIVHRYRETFRDFVVERQGGHYVRTKQPASNGAAPAASMEPPEVLGDGTALRLALLSQLLGAASGEPQVEFVLGSGVVEGSVNVGRVCDAVGVADLAAQLAWRFGAGCRVRSRLDVDFLEDCAHRDDEALSSWRPHLVISGLGDVNAVTAHVIRHYRDAGMPVLPGPADPPHMTFVGSDGELIVGSVPHLGWLAAVRSPWWPDRLCILAAGVSGTGTIAALRLLERLLSPDNGVALSSYSTLLLAHPRNKYPSVELKKRHDERLCVFDVLPGEQGFTVLGGPQSTWPGSARA